MSPEFKKFTIKLLIVGAITLLIGGVAFMFFFKEYYMPIYLWSLVFFFFVTLLVHAYQLKKAKAGVAKFTRTSMVVTFLKLLIYSAFIIIRLAISTEQAIVFVVVIMAIYIIFTVTEVSDLTKYVRAAKKQR